MGKKSRDRSKIFDHLHSLDTHNSLYNYHHVAPVSHGGGDVTLQKMLKEHHKKLHLIQNLKDAKIHDFWNNHVLPESDRILESAMDYITKKLLESAFEILSLNAQGVYLTQGDVKGSTFVRWARLDINNARDKKQVSLSSHLIKYMIRQIWTPFFNKMYQHDFVLGQEIWIPQMHGLNASHKTLSGELLIPKSDEQYIARNRKKFAEVMNQLLLEIENEYKKI